MLQLGDIKVVKPNARVSSATADALSKHSLHRNASTQAVNHNVAENTTVKEIQTTEGTSDNIVRRQLERRDLIAKKCAKYSKTMYVYVTTNVNIDNTRAQCVRVRV